MERSSSDTTGTGLIDDEKSGNSCNLSTKTVKRNEEHLSTMNKDELLELLGAMEGELQAKEIALATLEAERVKQYIFQARYGTFLATDPVHALQRDLVQHPTQKLSIDKSLRAEKSIDVMEHLLQTCNEGQKCAQKQLATITDEHRKVSLALENMKASVCDYDEVVLSEKRMKQNNMELLLELNDLKTRVELHGEERTALLELLKSEQETNKIQQLATSILVQDRKKCASKISKLVTLIHELENTLQVEQSCSRSLSVKLTEAELKLESERLHFQKELSLKQRMLDRHNEELGIIRTELNELRNNRQNFKPIKDASNSQDCDDENEKHRAVTVNDRSLKDYRPSPTSTMLTSSEISPVKPPVDLLVSPARHVPKWQDLASTAPGGESSQLELISNSSCKSVSPGAGFSLRPSGGYEALMKANAEIHDMCSDTSNLESTIKVSDEDISELTDSLLSHETLAVQEKLDAYKDLLSPFDHNDESKELECVITIDHGVEGVSHQRDEMSMKRSIIGTVHVDRNMSWCELEKKLVSTFLNHISEVSTGLKTKKVSRVEADSQDSGSFTLGLTLSSVKYYSIERYHWSPGKSADRMPLEVLAGFCSNVITIKLCDLDSGHLDKIAYDTLIPVVLLQNYLRLMEQYRCVIFYGPKGTGKTSLVQKLAECVQIKEKQNGNGSDITFHHLTESFTRTDLIRILIDKGCLLPSTTHSVPRATPIIILDDLSRISVVDVFKDILPVLETRGPSNQISVKNEDSLQLASYFMHPRCYIFGTMDRPRSTGLELSIQQRFKWVQLRCDQEPIKYLLHRHMFRRLAHCSSGSLLIHGNSLYKVVEWIVCVWQRLNDGLAKLGMLDIIFGPCLFLSCPVESGKPKVVMRWLSTLWNTVIAPTISSAVISSSTGFSASGASSSAATDVSGQRKIASTALYVLMQRAVVSGCPLSGQEKSRYFSTFQGSNDLDIKIKGDKDDQRTGATPLLLKDSTLAVTGDVVGSINRPQTACKRKDPHTAFAAVNQHNNRDSESTGRSHDTSHADSPRSTSLISNPRDTIGLPSDPSTSSIESVWTTSHERAHTSLSMKSTLVQASEESSGQVIVTQPVNFTSPVRQPFVSYTDRRLELNSDR